MRIAIVSDIHGNLAALEAVVGDIKRRGVDAIINLGDSLSGPLLPRETAHYLMAQDWVQLAGNHERQILALDGAKRGLSDAYAYSQLSAPELDWIASLTPHKQYSRQLFLCHGTPDCDVEHLLATVDGSRMRTASLSEVDARLGVVDAQVIACGHTHLALALRASSGQLVMNPGSVGLQAYEDREPVTYVVETGSPDARYAILEWTGSAWIAMLLTVPYAHQQMSALAASRNRLDWAEALMTGRYPAARALQ